MPAVLAGSAAYVPSEFEIRGWVKAPAKSE